jgi:putative spermidine/putrescine transport system permease protein
VEKREFPFLIILALPVLIVTTAFFLLAPGAPGDDRRQRRGRPVCLPGGGHHATLPAKPDCHHAALAGVTLVTLAISSVAGLFLERHRFAGRKILIALLTFPLAFPGVVVGFMVIMLAGRQGLIGEITLFLTGNKLVFAYSMAGLFLGYIYFSIPRVILTIMAAAEKLDPALEEAARSLGASPWRVTRDVILPALKPALIASGAIAFATAMGAFGTAFTLATNIDVLPMVIYTEFTLRANIAMAAALSIVLGIITWLVLGIARSMAGSTVSAAGDHEAYRSVLPATGLYPGGLRFSDRAGGDVAAGRNHRELLQRPVEWGHAALGDGGLGALLRHHLPFPADRHILPRLHHRPWRAGRLRAVQAPGSGSLGASRNCSPCHWLSRGWPSPWR